MRAGLEVPLNLAYPPPLELDDVHLASEHLLGHWHEVVVVGQEDDLGALSELGEHFEASLRAIII